MKKFANLALPTVFIGAFCCGGAILLLASSGWLLVLSTEARERHILLPLILLTIATIWLWRRQAGRCDLPGRTPKKYRYARDGLYLLWLLLIGVILAVYLFVPFWVPGYTGGTILF